MSVFLGGSAYTMVRDVAEGYIIATFGSLFTIILLELSPITKNIRPDVRNGRRSRTYPGDPEDDEREPEE